MGKVFSKVLKKLSADGPKRILMLGLDNAGRLPVDRVDNHRRRLF